MGKIDDVVTVELDKLREMRFPIAAQIEIEEKLKLSGLELQMRLLTGSILVIRHVTWIGLKHQDPKIGPLSGIDALLEKARGREIEMDELDDEGYETGKKLEGHINNLYLAGRCIRGLRQAGAFGEQRAPRPPAEEEGDGVDPSKALSPST